MVAELTPGWATSSLDTDFLPSPARDGPPRVGIEHEFAVFVDGEQRRFTELIHELGVDGFAVHPTDPDFYFTPIGSSIMADGAVAEVATPPIEVTPGFTAELDRWVGRSTDLLHDALSDDMTTEGGSTHISVSVSGRRNDRLALVYARTFAAALMLLMDRPESPGMLVRPRPGRTEFCGEYLTGPALRVAAGFAAVSVVALERALVEDGPLPPLLDVELEPGRRRYGWYVDRAAFGVDLYADGRQARLRLADGSTIGAGEYLANAWRFCATTSKDMLDAAEYSEIDRVVSGRTPIPVEDPGRALLPSANGLPAPHPMASVMRYRRHNGFTVAPKLATWDWVGLEVTGDMGMALAVIPLDSLESFGSSLEAGSLDESITTAMRANGDGPVFKHHSQAESPGLFSSAEVGPALLPEDRYGIGPGPATLARPGKLMPPASTSTGTGLVAAVMALFLAIMTLVPLARATAFQADEPDPRTHIESIDGVVDTSGQLWLRVVFSEPWSNGLPPRDLFSAFFGLDVDVGTGPSINFGWQIHDAAEQTYGSDLNGDPPRMFVLEDGSIMIATGFATFPGPIRVGFDTGSWVDQDTTEAVFENGLFTIEVNTLVSEDPLSYFGYPVFDLQAGETLSVPETTTTTTSTTTTTLAVAPPTSSALSVTTTTVGSTTTEPDSSTNREPSWFWIIGGGLLLLAGGWWLYNRPDGAPVPIYFEKGNPAAAR